jgi:hypothetical protein
MKVIRYTTSNDVTGYGQKAAVGRSLTVSQQYFAPRLIADTTKYCAVAAQSDRVWLHSAYLSGQLLSR